MVDSRSSNRIRCQGATYLRGSAISLTAISDFATAPASPNNTTLAFMNTTMTAANVTSTLKAGFRLGEDHISDASDSDQSAASERSLSPGKMSKAKKRKVRKQVGALTEELDDLLGAAFQAPTINGTTPGSAGGE
jgi:hypothetical protein